MTQIANVFRAALAPVFAAFLVTATWWPTTPEECDCFATAWKDEFGKIKAQCPTVDCLDASNGGECGEHETSPNRFWCECQDDEDKWHVPDACLCRSGWRWSPTDLEADPHCRNEDCTNVCNTVPDADIPVGQNNSVQVCDCY